VYPRVAPAGLRGGTVDHELQDSLRESGREVIEGLDVEGVGRRMLVAGSPAQALHEVAEEERASLLLVGATHHGHVGRVVPGSVASKLLHGAPCPVLVVPADCVPGPIRTIVVAYDDREQSRGALREAVKLARAFNAQLRLVAAHEPEVFAGPSMVAAADLESVMRDDLAIRVKAQADAITGIDVDATVATGAAADVVIDAAHGADLIVAGSRGYGPLHSVLAGGVSRRLADDAPCPVLIVPRQAEVAPDAVLETSISATQA
jgi:nucleotide-binding universal stress UspA family protein